MTSLNGNIFRVTDPLCGEFTGPGEIPTQRPVTRSFDVFFDLRLNNPLCKQPWGWWFETLSRSLWRHRNEKIKHAFPSDHNKPVSQSLQSIRQISHNAPFLSEMCTYVHIFVMEWCTMEYLSNAFWDLCKWFVIAIINSSRAEFAIGKNKIHFHFLIIHRYCDDGSWRR